LSIIEKSILCIFGLPVTRNSSRSLEEKKCKIDSKNIPAVSFVLRKGRLILTTSYLTISSLNVFRYSAKRNLITKFWEASRCYMK
jgi:hypothetical protein